MAATALLRAIVPLVADARGPLLLVGRLSLGVQLQAALPRLIVAESRGKPRQLARHRGTQPVLRCAPTLLPLRRRSVQTLILGQGFCRDGNAELQRLCAVLADGGRLLLVQPLRGVLAHGLHSFGRGLPRYRPEDITALLLGGGFTAIVQHWPDARAVLTCGTLRRLPEHDELARE